MNRLIFLLVPIFLITAACGGGGSSSSSTESGVTLAWTAPTLNADGSTLKDLAGYKIYYGPSSGNYTGGSIDNILTTSYNTQALPAGYYCFVVVAYDTSGNESTYSNELCTTL